MQKSSQKTSKSQKPEEQMCIGTYRAGKTRSQKQSRNKKINNQKIKQNQTGTRQTPNPGTK